MKPIRPDLLAGKLETGWLAEAQANHPSRTAAQLNELLWFLQYRSAQPGGLAEMVDTLIELYPGRFSNTAMRAIGIPHGGKYSMSQCIEVWKCEREQPEMRVACLWRNYENDKWPRDFDGWLDLTIDEEVTPEAWKRSPKAIQDELRYGLDKFNLDFFKERYTSETKQRLPSYLHDLCEHKSTDLASPWYCPSLVETLFDYLSHWADEHAKAITETTVSRIVFRELEFSISQNVPVPIIGESRIGKSSPASTWCLMRPGRARLVTVPESNRMRDFIEAHARALGIEHTLTTSTSALTAAVKFVHRHSRLFICYDESQNLIPAVYNKLTPPARLNFVRFQVIDPGISCCSFFATPQSYKQTLDQYSKTTGHRMEQWLGRLAEPIILPPDLSKEDLMGVAKHNFPEIPEPYLMLISARAMKSEGYIRNMDFAVRRARFIAQECGRKTPNLEDIKQAIDYAMPPQVTPPARTERPVSTARKTTVQSDCNPDSTAVKNDRETVVQRPNLSDRSLNPICPARGEVELVENHA